MLRRESETTQQTSSPSATVRTPIPSLRLLPVGGFLFRNLAKIQKYQDIVRLNFGVSAFYLVMNPEFIQEVLVTKQGSFVKGEYLQRTKRVFGEGLLTSEGSFHHRQRRLVQPAFHRDRIASYSRVMADYTEQMVSTWRDGQVLDLHKEMMRLTMSVVAKCLFGTDVESESESIGRDLTTTIEYFNRLSSPLSQILQRLPTNRKYEDAVQRINSLVYRLIETKRASADGGGDLISLLLDARDDQGDTMTDVQVRDEVLILFAAGHETTANALTWTYYLISQNPSVEAKLHAEVDREIQEDGHVTSEDAPKLEYTTRVLTESMRLYPPAWVLVRKAMMETHLGSYVIPKGADVVISQYVNHRDGRYFQEPETFMPDRWTDEMRERLPKFAYFPFGGGARSCVGEPFAWMEGVLLLAAISRRWRMRYVGGRKAEMLPRITLRPKYGMKMELQRRFA